MDDGFNEGIMERQTIAAADADDLPDPLTLHFISRWFSTTLAYLQKSSR
jgi:hypothetical protein